jgi:hypothetical protein
MSWRPFGHRTDLFDPLNLVDRSFGTHGETIAESVLTITVGPTISRVKQDVHQTPSCTYTTTSSYEQLPCIVDRNTIKTLKIIETKKGLFIRKYFKILEGIRP